MRLQSPNPTHVFAVFPAALRGGAADGSRDGPPPGVSGESVPGRLANRRLTPAPDTRAYNAYNRPAASGQRPAASGMTCAGRPAGARKPAPPTSAYSRGPDARIRRSRARLSLLPVLALLLGALSLLAAGTAEAEPAAPTSPNVKIGDRSLTLSWTAPTGSLTGYEVYYTSAVASAVANGAAPTGTNPATSWVQATDSLTGSSTEFTFTSLTNSVAYRVRVRAQDSDGNGAYAFGTGTPKTPVMEFDLDTALVAETDTTPEDVKVVMSPAPAQQTTVDIRVRASGTTAVPADYTLSTTTLTFAAGDTEKTFPVLATADMMTEGGERLFLELVPLASAPYTLGGNNHIELVIIDDSVTPGQPGDTRLRPVESGTNAPTATTLSFTIDCAEAYPGFPITDFKVHAVVHRDYPPRVERTYYFPDKKCGSNGPVTLTGLPLRATETTWQVRAQARAIRGHKGPWSQWAELATLADPAQQSAAALTASFAGVPSAHTGNEGTFSVTVNFNVSVDGGQVPTQRSFETSEGSVTQVVRVSGKKWTVHVRPASWRKVGIALRGGRGCDDPLAVCATGGRALTNSLEASVGGAARIRVSSHWAREGTEKPVRFIVKLNRAVSHVVRVDYATKDGVGMLGKNAPAAAGADYTATSGTLVFTAGQRRKTVNVAVTDDSIDEGAEYFLLVLSNPQGAHLPHRQVERVGLIRNSDPLQQAWLARFGRMVASDTVKMVTTRLETPRDAGSHLTFAGQRLDLTGDGAGDSRALADAMAGLARAFGAEEARAPDDDPFARHGIGGWNDPASAPGRAMTGRELLLGSSFRAVLGQDAGSQWTSWGQGASVSRFSAAVPGLDLNGESATGSMGMDYERGRLLAGFAMTHSIGEGTAQDEGWRYAMGSTATMMLPYARLALTERISAWGLAGTGTGSLTLDLDGAVAQRYRTDLSMTLAAAGVRGDLLTPTEAGGFALALKADAFWVRTESDRVTASRFGGLMGARGDSSRVRAMLDGSRTFALAGGATLAPKLELGVRHDGGDAESGTGLELGAGLGYADPARGLDMALKVHGLAVHAEDGYDEWGVSGSLRLAPGATGRGLSASLTPSYGVDPTGSERLWAEPASSGLAANGDPVPSSRLDAELGYGLPVFGGGFTGTPNVGFGLSDASRDLRLGWRLTSGAGPGFELNLDAVRREAANDDAEHGVMLRSRLRW